MLELGLKILISYLVGALNGSLILGRLSGVDIRTLGSGNAGGTNALRTMGKGFAARVMLIDVGKGWLPPVLLPGLLIPGVGLDPAVSREWLVLACAGAAIVGHCYPVWFQFRGGKGAATALGALLGVAPLLFLPGLVAWVLVLVLTGFVGLATMLAAAALPFAALLLLPARAELALFLAGLAVFIAWTHRDNIRRMRAGCENRLSQAMLLRRPR
ncbi:MAG: glycerol-3-phosphate 1-O-acyltransferase PlsY [Chromatiales bacterium]|nr:glycerol-3-phosphate 1-O-acyltransferase PlsY [Chromatiales bacterium]